MTYLGQHKKLASEVRSRQNLIATGRMSLTLFASSAGSIPGSKWSVGREKGMKQNNQIVAAYTMVPRYPSYHPFI